MLKIITTLSVCFLVTSSLFAQKPAPVKFGDVLPEIIKMKVYPKDSSAEAVVLYDGGETYFEIMGSNIFITQIIHERIKILKKSALERGSIKIPVVRVNGTIQEFLSDIKGFTYNDNNGSPTKDKLTKDMIFQEKASETVYYTKISMPNIKEGSVIEYSYKKQTPMPISNNPATWYFQQGIPVERSDYKITIPAYFYYRMIMNGYLPLALNENKDVNISEFNINGLQYHFVVLDAPAFRDESYITTESDYLSKIDFELASVNWPNVLMKDFSLDYANLNKTLLESEDFGQQLKRTGFLKDIASEIKTKHRDSTARMQAAVDYIVKTVKWNGERSIYSTGLRKIHDKKTGDAADINLMLIALLREIGFDANPVILSTRDHGRIHEQYALMRRFNYVVAHIDNNGKDLLIDATDEFLKVGMLPYQCLNHNGWLVHPTFPRLVSLEPTERDVEFEKAEMKIDEEGEMKGQFTKSYSGYSAWGARQTFKKEGKEKFLEEVKKAKTNWTISQAEYQNNDDISQQMEAKYEVTMTDFVTKAGNMMYLKPMLSEGHTENPFKDTERTYPIDFAMPIDETFMANYEIPAGYSVIEKPQSVSLTLPEGGGRFTHAVTVRENTISVLSRLSFRKAQYAPEEYPFLKEFYDQIVKKHNEQIVLKKQ